LEKLLIVSCWSSTFFDFLCTILPGYPSLLQTRGVILKLASLRLQISWFLAHVCLCHGNGRSLSRIIHPNIDQRRRSVWALFKGNKASRRIARSTARRKHSYTKFL
jgi:hypothetical protein